MRDRSGTADGVGVIERLPATAKGIAYMLVATALFALVWVLVRLASETLDPALIVFYRTLFGLMVMGPALFRQSTMLFSGGRTGLYLMRAAIGLLAMYANFYAVAHAPLADVVAISYASPLFATLVAVLLLGEVIRARRMSALAIGFLGVLAVLRPGMQELAPGHYAAIAGAVFVAISLTTIKLLSATDRPERIVGFTFLLMLPVTFAVALFVWVWPSPREFALLVVIGISANMAHMALTRAFAAADVSAVMPFDFLRLVIAAAFGALLFGEALEWETVTGAAVILLSSVYLAHREARLARDTTPRAPPPLAEGH